jgi:hypothetical protein
MQSEPTIRNVPDVPTLAKNYINAEKLIGAKRFAIPGKDAPPEAWNEVFSALGRPESHEKYSPANVKPVDGLTVDEVAMQEAKQTFHKLGLSDSQARGIMDFYVGGLNKNHTTVSESIQTQRAQATEALRNDWGVKFDSNMEIAKAALKQFGGDEVYKELESGLGNNLGLIKMLHKIGTNLMEDRARGGSQSGGFQVSGATEAQSQIETLKSDIEFQKALNDNRHAGHKGAVDRWMDLHRKAFVGTVAAS